MAKASDFPVDFNKKDREYDDLRNRCMTAVQCGYVDVLETVSKRLPHFEFNFKLNLGLVRLLYCIICNIIIGFRMEKRKYSHPYCMLVNAIDLLL